MMEISKVPPISMKKVLIAIVIVVMLSRLDRIIAFISAVYKTIDDSLEPARNFSSDLKYCILLAIFALLYISIFKLLYEKMRKK